MNRLAKIGLAAGIAVFLLGCGGSGNGLINTPNPRVRFANVFPGIASAKAKVGPDIISSDIPFGQVSEYAITPNGNKDMTAGDSTFENLATLSDELYETNKRYTGIGYGTSPRTIMLLEEDKSGASNDTVALRAVHAAQGGGNVDVYVSGPADPLPGAPSFDNMAVGSTSLFTNVPVGGTNQYRIRVFPDGNTTTALVDTTLTINAEDRVSIILYSDAGVASGVNRLVLKENID